MCLQANKVRLPIIARHVSSHPKQTHGHVKKIRTRRLDNSQCVFARTPD
jgi:hypothetical protein